MVLFPSRISSKCNRNRRLFDQRRDWTENFTADDCCRCKHVVCVRPAWRTRFCRPRSRGVFIDSDYDLAHVGNAHLGDVREVSSSFEFEIETLDDLLESSTGERIMCTLLESCALSEYASLTESLLLLACCLI